MLTSYRKSDNVKLLARNATKEEGPFYCPECNDETILHKGSVKVHHFAHKPPISCKYGAGESVEHAYCKEQIYNGLCKVDTLYCEMERSLGEARPDIFVYSRASKKSYAIEVQISNLSMSEIALRTMRYAALDIYVLWLTPVPPTMFGNKIYSPTLWEKWLHAAYFGKVYYWVQDLRLQPVHFGKYYTWVDGNDYGGHYWKQSKRKKRLYYGEETSILKLRPAERQEWEGGDIFIPRCKLLSDHDRAWWKEDEDEYTRELRQSLFR